MKIEDCFEMSTEEYTKILKEKLQYWQHALLLDHYKILFTVDDETKNFEAIAQINVDPELVTAHIVFLHPKLSENKMIQYFTVDEVIVHELLHIHFDSFFPKEVDTTKVMNAEASINLLSRAFLEINKKWLTATQNSNK